MKLPKTLKCFEWDDLEAFFCEYLDIDEKHFRNYHEVIGGNCKDFWHVWLCIVSDDVHNGHGSKVWDFVVEEDVYQEIEDKYGKWATKLLDATACLFESIEEDSFMVYYWW